MKFTFRGVRGSIPSPGPRTARYGGNTTCIEVRTDNDSLIILDAGSGIFSLAQQLPPGLPVDAHVFITHSHWDHIHGLPMFSPLFVAGNRMRLHGAHDAVAGRGIEHVMAVQLQDSYFPVSEAAMAACIEYRTLAPGETVEVGGACVRGAEMNHPVANLGYRIDCGGASLFFSGDHEPFYNLHPPGHADHAACAERNVQRQDGIDALVAGIDALIMDFVHARGIPGQAGLGPRHLRRRLRPGPALPRAAPVLHPPRTDPQRRTARSRVCRRNGPLCGPPGWLAGIPRLRRTHGGTGLSGGGTMLHTERWDRPPRGIMDTYHSRRAP